VRKLTYRLRAAAHGFTLIELIVTLSIAAALFAFAVPNLRNTLRNGELASTANDMIHSLQLARTEAVKRQRPVVFCASTNPLAAAPACAIGAQVGWIVFEDDAGTQQWAAASDPPIIERHDLISTDITIKGDGTGMQSYTALGFASPGNGGTFVPSRNIVLCDSRGNLRNGNNSTARAVLISATGRGRVSALYVDVTNTLATLGTTCP
jgi:type IV fimbrial biogenesis protein FimT